ncbi:MAG TPA: HDIG domain-containing protein [Tepidisphaeraceae bacterium]|nr:HDIG domain-containing protein [Tepidisphaeraceae bacterium]
MSTPKSIFRHLRASGAIGSIYLAGIFFAAATAILMLRQEVIPFRPGQYVSHNITSRVDFDFVDPDQLDRLRQRAMAMEPRVYVADDGDYWGALQDDLMTLPDRTYHHEPSELPDELRGVLDPGDLSALERFHDRDRLQYDRSVRRYVAQVKQQFTIGGSPLVVLPKADRDQELNRVAPEGQEMVRYVTLISPGVDVERKANVATETYSTDLPPEALIQLQNLAQEFPLSLKTAIAQLTFQFVEEHPTHHLDLQATRAALDRASDDVSPADAAEHYAYNTIIVPAGQITDRDWELLRAENQAFLKTEQSAWLQRLAGTAITVFCLTVVLCAFIARYQPRLVRNQWRGAALMGLMLAMLLISALAGIGSGSLYLFGIAPTILAALILTIAYDQRFAIGVGGLQATLSTLALNESIGFFLILLVGVLVACFLLDDIRTRSKLIEVGGASAIAMILVAAASGLTSLDEIHVVAHNCLDAGAAGLAAGFITLGILPFIEKTFHITTSMTLLELADATHPLLRRLSMEAPGTYSHSLQVATLAEAAAEAIGANSLACRVGGYYHDIGKINKPDYFAENQVGSAPSRHISLSPSVSLMIIIGHVKDGMELAQQYHLPPKITQFIQQHHGTTLVEYFYQEACKQTAEGPAGVPETKYRYPGPKPKSRETGIMMLADCCESACRAMTQPTAECIEKLVHELTIRRMHDGQFDECDLTMRNLEMIQRSLIKSLIGVYHSRMAYPSTSSVTDAPPARKMA